MASERLKILSVAAEVAPFAKVGGLADVAGALPKALKALGHDVRVAMPCYRMIEDSSAWTVEDAVRPFRVPIHDGQLESAHVRQTSIPTPCGPIPVYLIANDQFFRDATESRKVYSLAPEPYIFFNRAVAEFVPRLSPNWTPDIVHCHDWQAGLIPVYLQTFYAAHPTWADTARIFTIHNLAYKGDFDRDVLHRAGLPDHLFTYDKLEFYGRMAFMKGGLVFSDRVNTVSPTYAREIQTPEYGCGMEGLLRYLASQGRLTGILNGVDDDEYNPATDPHIAAHFSADDLAGKARCKAALQAECGLPKSATTPVIGMVSRLADQKGLDLIGELANCMADLPIQVVLLGVGDPRYEAFLDEWEATYPKRVKSYVRFDADLARRIYAGSDLFLMPSRFEPCGLGQLMSLRYGTIPIVRATGGLADTIHDLDPMGNRGNGFVFTEYSSSSLLYTIGRAVEAFRNRSVWTALVKRALREDFSWARSAEEYVELYRQALSASREAAAA